MPHQAGWIELYSAIEEGKEFSEELVELCRSSLRIEKIKTDISLKKR